MRQLKVTRLWAHNHGRAVEFVSMARGSGDVAALDRRERIVFLDSSGKAIWDRKLPSAPLAARVTYDGEMVFILTCDGRLLRVTRQAELEWEKWVDKHPITLAIKSRGQAAVVVCQRGRLHVISSGGERSRILHTPVPVAHARISARTGNLFVASAQGWLGRYDSRFNPMGEVYLDTLVTQVEVCEKGKKILLPSREAGLNVIDLDGGHMTTYNPGFSVIKAGVDENGGRIALISLDGDIAVMDMEGRVLWSSKTDDSWVLCDMSGKGDRFVAVSDKGLVVCYGIGEKSAGKEKSHFDFIEV